MASVKAYHKINAAKLEYILKSPAGPAARDLIKRGIRVQNRARRNLAGATGSGPRRIDTGLLRSSIHTNLMTGGPFLVMRVGSGQYYALWVHDGTGIYGPKARPIKPKVASHLVFKWKKMGNKQMFLKEVKGMRPNPYLEAAMVVANLKIPG